MNDLDRDGLQRSGMANGVGSLLNSHWKGTACQLDPIRHPIGDGLIVEVKGCVVDGALSPLPIRIYAPGT
jgi:hypothetical protein